MIIIDEYSLAALPIEMHFNEIQLSAGSAFVWAQEDASYLITNWHNVSGRNAKNAKHLSKTAAEPDKLQVWFNQKGALGNKIVKSVRLRDQEGRPTWLVHPSLGRGVDVVALRLGDLPDIDMYPINKMSSDALMLSIGMDVYVLGYPFGLGVAGLPVWKRGSFSSEPSLSPHIQTHILVDTASRPGMSGSPVIRRSWGNHSLEGNNIAMGSGTATRFVGVYSGRLGTDDPLDAQLGVTWPASLVTEIVDGQVVDHEFC